MFPLFVIAAVGLFIWHSKKKAAPIGPAPSMKLTPDKSESYQDLPPPVQEQPSAPPQDGGGGSGGGSGGGGAIADVVTPASPTVDLSKVAAVVSKGVAGAVKPVAPIGIKLSSQTAPTSSGIMSTGVVSRPAIFNPEPTTGPSLSNVKSTFTKR